MIDVARKRKADSQRLRSFNESPPTSVSAAQDGPESSMDTRAVAREAARTWLMRGTSWYGGVRAWLCVAGTVVVLRGTPSPETGACHRISRRHPRESRRRRARD